MIKTRLVAVLLVNNGVVVQTRKFKRTNMVGNAFTAVDFFNGWAVDEICILDISSSADYTDQFVGIVEELSRRCFVPLTIGGKIRDIALAHRYIRAGADKLVVNTGAALRPALIGEIADAYGSQCVVLSLDARPSEIAASGYEAMVDNGRRETGLDAIAWAAEAVSLGAGEILANAIEHDGDKRGYDLDYIAKVSAAAATPVIAMGGVGEWAHLVAGAREGGAAAVAAGNILHYSEHSTKKAKEFMGEAGLPVRRTAFYKLSSPRRVKYSPFQGA